MHKVILTGGNGFVGSHLVAALGQRGVKVHAIANTNHQRLDQLLPPEQIHVLKHEAYAACDLVTQVQPDAIFHLASVYAEPSSIDRIASMLDGNLALGAALLHGAAQCQHRPVFINTGTYWQYSEAGEYSPNSFYASTKQAFQDLLVFYERKEAIQATTLVLYDTFGEDDTRPKLWNALINAPRGTVFPLSAGEQIIKLVHIDDVVRAFLQVADLMSCGQMLLPTYALCADGQRTLRQIVEELNHRADLGLFPDFGARPYWEGQVMIPWEGLPPPGWTPEIEPVDRMVHMAFMRKSRQEIYSS